MDIIFAAVPKTNPNARCEILRMTNVNTRHKYRSYIDAIESDINVLTNVDTYTGASDSKIQSAPLNAIAGGTTAGNTNWQTTARYTEGFNVFLGIAGNGIGTASGGGYASKTNKNTISETVPLFSGFPIQESITIKGWAVCIDSISSYYYSTDDGKTWEEITGTRANGNPAAGLNDQALWWMDRSITTADTGNSLFTEDSTALKINLSKYKGQSIDLLVAAKPVGRDSYCPIAKIDKVLVYGPYLYYSRLDSITIDDSLSINNDVSGEAGEINIYGYEDLRLSTNLIKSEAHTIYEPYGIDVLSSRKTVAQTVSISNGGKISLNGFCFAHGGVKEYRYTIDGGKTWTTINKDITYNSPDNAIMKIIKLTSTSMTADSGKNGNFSSGHGSSRTLDFNIPNTFNSGDTFNLILAGISKYGDNVPFPVLNMTLRIK